MHLKSVKVFPERFPTNKYYPFNLQTFHHTRDLDLNSPVIFFVGENGTGKSTLLEAIAQKSGIHMWQSTEGVRFDANPYEKMLYRYIAIEWMDGYVAGSFFSGEMFRDFSRFLDDWAVRDPGIFEYFGGKSLLTQSHGQALMSFFEARYKRKGLYLLDEPETALSPKSQLELLKVIKEMSQTGHAQFIIATHSPILMACPEAGIYSFDCVPLERIDYKKTDHYRIYREFFLEREEDY
jgi:predicted ATPase